MNKIPKIIHYCWFGNKNMSKLNKKCIESWHKCLDGYTFMLWNEENFDINSNRYVKEAYEAKKFAFVSDYVRLFALKKYGGIYLDTDMEILKNMDEFLSDRLFFGVDNTKKIQTSIIGSISENFYINEWIKCYDELSFRNKDGKYDLTPNVDRITEIIKKNNIDNNEIKIYSKEYFFPINSRTYEKVITPNTYAIHHYEATWLKNKDKFKILIKKLIKNIFGVEFLKYIRGVKK